MRFRMVLLSTVLLAVAALSASSSPGPQSEPRAPEMIPAAAGFTASVTCDFLGPRRRGVCSAQPRGTGFTYQFYTSPGISVATGPIGSPDRSATCSRAGTITVQVTDAAGQVASASTSTRCSNR